MCRILFDCSFVNGFSRGGLRRMFIVPLDIGELISEAHPNENPVTKLNHTPYATTGHESFLMLNLTANDNHLS